MHSVEETRNFLEVSHKSLAVMRALAGFLMQDGLTECVSDRSMDDPGDNSLEILVQLRFHWVSSMF